MSFCIICFADLKKYKFTYLFGFPAVHIEHAWQISDADHAANDGEELSGKRISSRQQLSGDETALLVDKVQTWRYSVDARQHGFFLAKRVRGHLGALETPDDVDESSSYTSTYPAAILGFQWVVAAIEHYEKGFFEAVPVDDQFICFADPSSHPIYPAWILRNLLVLMHHRWKLNRAQILCYRDLQSRRHEARSFILKISSNGEFTEAQNPVSCTSDSSAMPKITGWERNHAGKFASKVANLGEYMDPQR